MASDTWSMNTALVGQFFFGLYIVVLFFGFLAWVFVIRDLLLVLSFLLGYYLGSFFLYQHYTKGSFEIV